MFHFTLRKTGAMLLTMAATSLVLFLLLELSPSNVATKVLGPYSSEEQRQVWLEKNGYLRPAPVRYFSWLGKVLSGSFGDSIRFRAPVGEVLWPRLGNTAILAGMVLLIVVPVSLVLGVLAGMREGSLLDRLLSFFGVFTTSLPEFASAVGLVAVFVFFLDWLPGTSTMSDGFNFREMILPVLVLSIYDMGYVMRMTRASMVEVMTSPFIRTAILKGLPYSRVIWRHALHNALITPFTIIMLQINWLLSGVIVVEFFFAYKGFGGLIFEASLNQDLYLLEACTLVSVAVAIATQFFSDIGYALINPRIRVS